MQRGSPKYIGVKQVHQSNPRQPIVSHNERGRACHIRRELGPTMHEAQGKSMRKLQDASGRAARRSRE
jgi:hypothetical protein